MTVIVTPVTAFLAALRSVARLMPTPILGDDASDCDSLFDGSEAGGGDSGDPNSRGTYARRHAPPIPGLSFNPSILISQSLSTELLEHMKTSDYFRGGAINQVMLFGKSGKSTGGLPPFIQTLLHALSELLEPVIPEKTHTLLFPNPSGPHLYPARQVTLNLYRPGDGITPHIDLLQRFGDGIILLSLGSGIAMELANKAGDITHELWLPSRSLLVLEGEARYEWTHGIQRRIVDRVENEDGNGGSEDIERGTRVSITIRWLLPGAEVVGGPSNR
jgi:hypothetical protein